MKVFFFSKDEDGNLVEKFISQDRNGENVCSNDGKHTDDGKYTTSSDGKQKMKKNTAE